MKLPNHSFSMSVLLVGYARHTQPRVRTQAVSGRHSRLGKLVPGNGFNLLLWKRIFLKVLAVGRGKVRISNLWEV